MCFYVPETIRWFANPAPPNSAIAPDPQRAGLSNGPLPVKDDLWTKPKQGIPWYTSDPASCNFVTQPGRLPNKVCAEIGDPQFHGLTGLTIWGQWGVQPRFVKPMSNIVKPLLDLLGVDLQDLCWQPIHWLRVAKGQHHHVLESLVGFTSSSRKYPQMAHNDRDWQPAAAPGVCWLFSLFLLPAERMWTRSGLEIRGHPHILGAWVRKAAHDRRIRLILLTSWASFASFWAFLSSSCNVSFSAWKQLSAQKAPVEVNLSHCLNVWRA